MNPLKKLIENNKRWAKENTDKNPSFFIDGAKGQKPSYLWISCSDSRLPASRIVDLQPGELFVHRNIANLFVHTDINSLSVLEFAVNYLQVEHVIVCGHHGCGGVAAAMGNKPHGLIDNWLRNIREVYEKNREELDAIESQEERQDRLSELSVKKQVLNICHTNIVQSAWTRGQSLGVHGLVYILKEGLIRDLDCSVYDIEAIDPAYRLV